MAGIFSMQWKENCSPDLSQQEGKKKRFSLFFFPVLPPGQNLTVLLNLWTTNDLWSPKSKFLDLFFTLDLLKLLDPQVEIFRSFWILDPLGPNNPKQFATYHFKWDVVYVVRNTTADSFLANTPCMLYTPHTYNYTAINVLAYLVGNMECFLYHIPLAVWPVGEEVEFEFPPWGRLCMLGPIINCQTFGHALADHFPICVPKWCKGDLSTQTWPSILS